MIRITHTMLNSIHFSLLLFITKIIIEAICGSQVDFLSTIFSLNTLYFIGGTTLFFEAIQGSRLTMKVILLFFFGLFFTVITSVNLMTEKYYNLDLLSVILNLIQFNINLANLPNLIHQYASAKYIIIPLLFIAPLLVYSFKLCKKNQPHSKLFIVSIILFLSFTLLAENLFHQNKSIPFLIFSSTERRQPHMTNLLVPLPKTIVLFINESTSDQFTSALNQHLSLKNRLIQLSGKSPGEWTIFPFSVTNSTQTIVSMSTLTTGVGPQEGYSKVHRFPFIWDLAKKRGYETAYFTSQVIHFMNLDIFFNPAKIDHLVSAENYPSPLINDMGIDDIEMAKKVADYLMHASSDQRIFLVINTNALHGPFQDKSSIKIPLTIQDRHAKARYILEEAHRIIFNALTTSSRFDDSLIIITADHGEDPLNRRGINRMIGHYEEFIRIPFAIYLPKNFPAHLKAIIHSNTNRLVSNLDIAPTLLTIFGLQLATHDHYSGYSLLTPIPANRLSVSMSTNEWNQWPDTGFALARGHERFVCISKQLCAYYNVAIDPSERKPIKSGNAFARYLKEVLSIDVLKKEIAML